MSEQKEVDSKVTIKKKDNTEQPYFKENATDENGIVLFTTTPNQLNWRDVKRAFIECNLGWVERVDLIPSGKYKKAYIYFEKGKWNMDEKENEYMHLQAGKSIRVYYQEQRYFNTRVSTVKRSTREEAMRRLPQVRVEIFQQRNDEEKTNV